MVKWKNEDEHEARDCRECEEDPEEDEVNLRRSIQQLIASNVPKS